MTGAELIEAVLEKHPFLSPKAAEAFIKQGFQQMTEALAQGERIAL